MFTPVQGSQGSSRHDRVSEIEPAYDVHLGVVCPMANEALTASRFVSAVLSECRTEGVRETTFFVILDRAGKDDTLERLRSLAAEELDLRVIWAPENRNVVDGYVRGYRDALAAGCDWILEIDAGFSHQPADIPQFFRKMSEGNVCVFGSRFCTGGSIATSAKRHFVSRSGTMLANLLLGTRLTDMTSGFELFSRPVLTAILASGIRSRAHFFQTEIRACCRNLRIVEVPIRYETASDGVTIAVLGDALLNLLRLTWKRFTGTLYLR